MKKPARIALFVVGAPGVGKSTLVRALLGPQLALASSLVSKPKWTSGPSSIINGLRPGWCAAGHYTGAAFDGGDTIPYSGAMEALAFWASDLAPISGLTVLDGDRMSYGKALEVVRNHVDRALCAFLTVPEAVLSERLAQRGSQQSAVWMKGRVSKSANFASGFGSDCLTVIATKPAATLATDLHAAIEAVIKEIP